MNEIFKRNKKTKIFFLLMPIILLFFLILQLIVTNDILKTHGVDNEFLFSKNMIIIYFFFWILISLIPLIFFKLILQKQKIIFFDKNIIQFNRNTITEINYDNVKGIHIYYKRKKVELIIIKGYDNSILIGDFDNKLKMIEILTQKIDKNKIEKIMK